jgi:hypothetical protein
MQVSSFDFDVITGPSAPRDGHEQPSEPEGRPTHPSDHRPSPAGPLGSGSAPPEPRSR